MLKKVLVVDDDVDILEGIKLILELGGFAVATTSRGEEALRKVEEFHPDMIFLDVRMSGSDGRTICKKLKSRKKTKNIPVVMIAADLSTQKTSFISGANEFLAKPFDTNDLIDMVRKYTAD